jgi:hypothetical protein
VGALMISSGHNYFGHHGRPPGAHPMIFADQLECVAGRGIRGDRFFGYRDDYKGQITFFSGEVFDALRREVPGAAAAPPTALRRNVLLRGVELDALTGRTFSLQGVRFCGTEECRPCYWMDRAVAPGTEAWLRGRGGLRARILGDGALRSAAACELVFE